MFDFARTSAPASRSLRIWNASLAGIEPFNDSDPADYFFVGPDNGIFSLALDSEKIETIRRLEMESQPAAASDPP